MRILVTGKGGKSGSWAIRGEQLGHAIGAEVFAMAEMAEVGGSDLVVVVKRTPDIVLKKIRAAGKPWIYDIVDGWPQPYGNAWCQRDAINWLRSRLAQLKPNAVVFPTTRMLDDSGWTGPALVLPHHAWPKYSPQPLSAKVRRVGYEGGIDYLGRWREVIEAECKRRRWEFVINGDLAACQIGVALRDTQGYPAQHWKANTKVANLQALGIPAVCSPECGYREFSSGSEWWAVEAQDVTRAFDAWTYMGARRQARDAMLEAVQGLEQVARTYSAWLHQLSF